MRAERRQGMGWLVAAVVLGACSGSPATSTSGAPGTATSALATTSSAPPAPSPSTSSTTTASCPSPPCAPPPRHAKRPRGWKNEWSPAPEDVEDIANDYQLLNEVKGVQVPDAATCVIDGPFWPESASYFGTECSKEQNGVGCLEASNRLAEAGRWACARAYHEAGCKLGAGPFVAPPRGTPKGGDYPMAGYPQCPPAADGRYKWLARELKDPVKRGCYVEHQAERCMDLVVKMTADSAASARALLGGMAAAWEH